MYYHRVNVETSSIIHLYIITFSCSVHVNDLMHLYIIVLTLIHIYIYIYSKKKIISSLDETFFKELNKHQGLGFLIAQVFEGLLALSIHVHTYIH